MGRRNIEKHNINFEGAATMFGGVTLSRIAGREDYGEVRDISIGRVAVDTDVSYLATRDGNNRQAQLGALIAGGKGLR